MSSGVRLLDSHSILCDNLSNILDCSNDFRINTGLYRSDVFLEERTSF